MNLKATYIDKGASATVLELIGHMQERLDQNKKNARNSHERAKYWEGRYFVLRHENNKLRKENERLRKEMGE